MLNSLSAIAVAGSTSAATPRVTRSFFMSFSPHGNHGKSAACSARGDRNGKNAAEKRPAWPFVPGGVVGPVKLELQKDLARRLRAGHPWVYKRAIERPPSGLQAGSIVDVTSGGKFVARGYYDPSGAVRVRVLTRDPAEAIGPLFWRRRIAKAVALRRAYVLSEETDCARLVHGEGDGLPGVVIDFYGRVAGRRLARARARGANCFSCAGGFWVSAVRGGAGQVIPVAGDAGAIKLARRNFELNGIDPARHGFVTGDVLEFLRADQKPFDLI